MVIDAGWLDFLDLLVLFSFGLELEFELRFLLHPLFLEPQHFPHELLGVVHRFLLPHFHCFRLHSLGVRKLFLQFDNLPFELLDGRKRKVSEDRRNPANPHH